MRATAIVYILLIAGASATAGAPAQLRITNEPDTVEVTDLFTDLVKIIGSADTIPLAAPAHQPSEAPASEMISERVFDFLSSAYEDNDYYESGYWETPEERRSMKIYTGALPDYVTAGFRHPVRGIVTSRFGLRPKGNSMHKGVDISLHVGDTVRVALEGKVQCIGYQKSGYGHFVIVTHPEGIQTRYAHLQRPLVQEGATLKAGDAIAIGGTSGNSTGPHLHFEIRCDGLPFDPAPLLTRKVTRQPAKQ